MNKTVESTLVDSILLSNACFQNECSNLLITEEIQRAWEHNPGIISGLKTSNQQSTLANGMWVLKTQKTTLYQMWPSMGKQVKRWWHGHACHNTARYARHLARICAYKISKAISVKVALFATVWHAEAFVQESVLDVTLRVRYNTAKVCNMTRYYSERSNRKIVHDNLALGRTKGAKAHLHELTELPGSCSCGK